MSSDWHIPSDVETLVREIGAYLATVECLRAAGREPTWRSELEESPGSPASASSLDRADVRLRAPAPRFTV